MNIFISLDFYKCFLALEKFTLLHLLRLPLWVPPESQICSKTDGYDFWWMLDFSTLLKDTLAGFTTQV